MGGIVSVASLSHIPMTYPEEYYAEIKVFDAKGKMLKEHKRTRYVKEWMYLIV